MVAIAKERKEKKKGEILGIKKQKIGGCVFVRT